jgi:hydrophobe/amphiphile efflux-1 (HAE1) family protein
MAAFGYSINNLTLFGLVLAVGIVVDDAIVVVENVERKLREGLAPRQAALVTMDEVGVALISIGLVLCAVFIPTAFLTGITGQFYRQFALTIAVATVISAFNSLTLSPALCAILLRPHGHERLHPLNPMRWLEAFFTGFNTAFDWLAAGYGRLVGFIIRVSPLMLLLYAGLIGLAAYMFATTPQGFVPLQDQGVLISSIELPPGASLSRTNEVVKRFEKMLRDTPGVAHTASFAGFSAATRTMSPSSGAVFFPLQPFEERAQKGQTAGKMLNDVRAATGKIQDANIIAIQPPTLRGVGTSGGFSMYIQDRAGRGLPALTQASYALMAAANKDPDLARVFTTFTATTPQLYVDVDRVKAQILDVPVDNIFETLRIYLGSAYVNDFNVFGRTYRVTAEADQQYRLTRLKVTSASGAQVPLGSVATFRDISGPYRMPRYNLFPAIEMQGSAAPGVSSGTALKKMEELAAKVLPDGIGFEWTDMSYQEKLASGQAIYIFALATLFVFLALAAQYESWTLPFAIVLIVPMCLLSAILGVAFHKMDVNILTQIGFVVLVGLAAKNAILIVEFARQLEDQGRTRFEAAVEASRLRLRPILMTSFAFTLGVMPLYMAVGAGAEMRQALGTAVFFGMLGVTLFGLIFTPVFYVVIRGLFPGHAHDHGELLQPKPAE